MIPVISYEPLWETLERKNISQYKLINEYSFSRGTLDALKHNRSISLTTLNNICNMLECTPFDVIRYVPDKKS
ncbi:MAG: helix-turn-helix transcriptional regulator [Aeriscardovia sp.]|nr:helix-turn-helix transcriptional regulator [Aeriscardovia sp.]